MTATTGWPAPNQPLWINMTPLEIRARAPISRSNRGVITTAEFDQEKAKVLGQDPGRNRASARVGPDGHEGAGTGDPGDQGQ